MSSRAIYEDLHRKYGETANDILLTIQSSGGAVVPFSPTDQTQMVLMKNMQTWWTRFWGWREGTPTYAWQMTIQVSEVRPPTHRGPIYVSKMADGVITTDRVTRTCGDTR